MAEEIETSWPMGSMPTGTRLERPNTPRNRLGTFEPLARASAELLRHARRQIPEVDAEHLAVNGKVFTDLATSSRYRIARGFVDWTAIPEHVVAFACRDGYLVPFTLEDHRGRESAVYLASMPTGTKVGGPTERNDPGNAQIY
jgi:hypothetical protein